MSDWSYDNIVKLHTSKAIDFAFYEDAEYQGLDPSIIYDNLVKRAIKLGKDDVQFAHDMEQVLIFHLRRGTNYTRKDFAARSKKGFETKVTKLMKDYEILERLGDDASSDVITVARVATVFPYVLCAFYLGGGATPIAYDPARSVPMHFCFPQGPAMMTPKEWEDNKSSWLDWSVAFTRTINRSTRQGKKSKKEKDDNDVNKMKDDALKSLQETYAENAHNSTFSKQKKKTWRTNANVMCDEVNAYVTKKNGNNAVAKTKLSL